MNLVQCKIFADNSKVFAKVTNELDKNMFQEDLNKICSRVNKGLIYMNEEKCCIMHAGRTQT